MILYSSTTSPYARKVRLLIQEKGLQSEIDDIMLNPFDDRAELLTINPLGQIPVLVLDDNEVLFDSPLICQYLDELSDQTRLIPQQKDQKYSVLRWQALADGLMDATYNIVMERRRDMSQRSTSGIDNWAEEVQNILQDMEKKRHELDGIVTLAQLAVAAAIGYLELRLPELLDDSSYPQLAGQPELLSWYEKFKTRPSMMATQP